MNVYNTLIIATLSTLIACNSKPDAPDANGAVPAIRLDAKDAVSYLPSKITTDSGQNADCLLDQSGTLIPFTTPQIFEMPVFSDHSGEDIVVTCRSQGQALTEILRSHPPYIHDNTSATYQNISAGPTAINTGQNGLANVLALGLSTSAVKGYFYIYPETVSFDF